MDRLSDYDYELPQDRIAAEPLDRRDASRLLVIERATGRLSHRGIADLPELLSPGDCLVLNDTRVLPARLLGSRTATGGKWEGLYLGTTDAGAWRLIGQSRGRIQPGETVTVVPADHRLASGERKPPETQPAHAGRSPGDDEHEELHLRLIERDAEGVWTAELDRPGSAVDLLEQFGTVPLPPYIHRERATPLDWQRYQTTFARRPGSVAAPTAGLHFTPELLAACRGRGIDLAWVTLHVGIGTFRPIAVHDLAEHHMHAEWCELPAETAEQLRRARSVGGRVVAVGTTTVRTLESVARNGPLRAWRGETDLFIRPPYEFRAIDALLTNFHLPKSSLLVMVSAVAGRELIRRAYAEAIRERYRFYSYGDAMLIV
ncbi:MAG: tRNA preQ1(34) S-adenosylmethionine ribosyltransferase-isomerase QueA [Planctomycetaceae bacterium]